MESAPPSLTVTVFEIVDASDRGRMYPQPISLVESEELVPPPWLAVAGHVGANDVELEWDLRVRAEDMSDVDVVAEFELAGRPACVSANAIVFVDSDGLWPTDVRALLALHDDVRRLCLAAPSQVPFLQTLFDIDAAQTRDENPSTAEFRSLLRRIGPEAVLGVIDAAEKGIRAGNAGAFLVDENDESMFSVSAGRFSFYAEDGQVRGVSVDDARREAQRMLERP